MWERVRVRGKKAFTLAEVLITLGIIGVVAAMTIPTLVADYQAKSWNTSATVFERKLEEALKAMNTQQSLAGYTTTEEFVAELSKHFKILKTCDNTKLTDCFSDTVYWGGGDATPEAVDMSTIKTSKNFGQKDWGTNIVGVQFANGTNALIAYNPITHSDDSTVKVCKQDPYSNQITGGDCLAILYDTSGYKSPNTSGKDLRANGNVKKLGSGCAFEIGGTCYTTTLFTSTAHVWNACDTKGNTTDPDDLAFMSKYEINTCMSSSNGTNDYWAGAIAACGGKDKMPTMVQLAELTTYMYDGMIASSEGNTNCPKDDSGNLTNCRNDNRTLSLGFPLSDFHVWAGDAQSSAERVLYRHFESERAGVTSGFRHGSWRMYTLCVDNS